MPVKPVPDGYHSINPYLIISGAAAALDFYSQAFGAQISFRMDMPDGKVGHAEIRIGDSCVMLADEFPEMGFRSPKSLGGAAVGLHLYIPDVDKVFQRAISLGAKEMSAVKDQFYGDRSGTLVDPFGHIWTVSTHMEDLTHEEIQKRQAEMK